MKERTEAPLLDTVPERLRALSPYSFPKSNLSTKLDANESCWPLPAFAREQVAKALASIDVHRYPDPAAAALRNAIAAKVGGPSDGLVLGSGSDEVIAMMIVAFSNARGGAQRASVLVPTPTFTMYRIGALVHGLDCIEVPLDASWQLDPAAMLAAIAKHRPNLIFLATPNNPTGNAFNESALDEIVRAAGDSIVVIDEAYAAFAGRSLNGWCERHANVAVLGTLSKVGFAAARIGWVKVSPALAREIDKVRQPYNLNALSQELGRMAFTELAPILDEHVTSIVAERQRLGNALRGVADIHVYPSDANFFLVRVDKNADTFTERLSSRGIAIRSFHGHGGRLDQHVRITVGTPAENDRLLDALT